jgi:hypothetical protein
MASIGTGSITASELLVSTLDQQGSTVFDQFYEKIPMLEWFRQQGKVSLSGGGNAAHIPITTGKNTSSGVTSGYKTLTTTPVDTLNYVVYALKRYYATITMDQDTKDKNRGPEQLINLVTYKIEEGKNSISDLISQHLFATSVATDAIDSLPVAIDSTGAVGGINQSSVSVWASYEAACGSFAAGGPEAMQLAYNTISKGKKSGTPGLIVTDQTSFQYYQNAVRAFGGDYFVTKGDLGVPELKFMGARVIWDPDCTPGNMFFLNSNAIGMWIDGENNMKSTPMVKPADQLAEVGQIYCRLQLVTRERRALGKLTGITA